MEVQLNRDYEWKVTEHSSEDGDVKYVVDTTPEDPAMKPKWAHKLFEITGQEVQEQAVLDEIERRTAVSVAT